MQLVELYRRTKAVLIVTVECAAHPATSSPISRSSSHNLSESWTGSGSLCHFHQPWEGIESSLRDMFTSSCSLLIFLWIIHALPMFWQLSRSWQPVWSMATTLTSEIARSMAEYLRTKQKLHFEQTIIFLFFHWLFIFSWHAGNIKNKKTKMRFHPRKCAFTPHKHSRNKTVILRIKLNSINQLGQALFEDLSDHVVLFL